ncbi:MAG: reductive dehalogenase domain-containing protein [Bacteroidota bacterium]|nr:reductive dehalogenase domain-containing protein [Bacteroidota bacterium]
MYIPDLTFWLFLVIGILILILLLLLLPWPEKDIVLDEGEPDRIDERTIMFSRAELKEGTKNFKEYYNEYPQHRQTDDEFRKAPGLMSEDSRFYHPWLFPAADASFYTVAALQSKTDGEVAKAKQNFDPAKLEKFIRNWAREMGCHSLGITTLKQSHLYSIGGRSHNYNEPVETTHSLAIAFTVEMDFDRVAASPRGPIIMESSTQYLKAGIIAVQLASFLRNLGYSSRAHIDGKYQVRCPQVARDAGLGEIGRMSLLMTPRLGPRVRIGVVTTEAPLPVSRVKRDSSVIRFCDICKKCADTCPAQALPSDERKITNGALTWTTNQEKCFGYWCQVGTDCGRCIAVCPYSHPDNFFHNIVRLFIRISPVFRQIAYKMDDWIYGRKPPSRELPDWMNPKN